MIEQTSLLSVVLLMAAQVCLVLGAQEQIVKAEAPITDVQVYPDRAEITRLMKLDVAAGRHRIEVDRLPLSLLEATLHHKVIQGKARILHVGVEDMHVPVHDPQQSEAVRAQIADLQKRQRELQDALVALAAREELWGSYRAQTLQTLRQQLQAAATDPVTWRQGLNTLAQEHQGIASARRQHETALHALRLQLNVLTKGIQTADADSEKVSHKRLVFWVHAAEAGQLQVSCSYRVAKGISWGPQYDLHLDRATSRLELVSRIMVRQSSGEDWSQARLRFSTRLLSRGLRPPRLHGLELHPVADLGRLSARERRQQMVDVVVEHVDTEDEEVTVDKPGAGQPAELQAVRNRNWGRMRFQAVSGGLDEVEFVAAETVRVPGDGSLTQVPLARWTVPCSWQLECVPDQSQAVYIRGRIRSPADLALQAGPAQIWVDGRYVGPGQVPAIAKGAAADLAFGSVEGIRVHRQAEPMRSQARENGLGNAYLNDLHISVRNASDQPVTLRVLESVPVSAVETVRIIIEDGTTKHSSIGEGIIAWPVSLQPGAEQKLRLVYRIEIDAADAAK